MILTGFLAPGNELPARETGLMALAMEGNGRKGREVGNDGA